MKSIRFERWCSAAVGRIRFKPDRQEVYEELYAHMEDQYEELIDVGLSEGEAEAEVAAAMGDPEETAYQLEKLHRPFWGYALRAARWCLFAAVLLAFLILPRYIWELDRNDLSAQDNAYFGEDREDEYCVDKLVWYAEPRVRARSDGYTFTVTRVSQRRRVMKDGGGFAGDSFYLQVEVFSPWPWAETSWALREFTAVDSLGNVYGAFNRTQGGNETPILSGNPTRTGLLTCAWTLWLYGYQSQEAEWIELRYQRSGRDVRLPIDLRDRKGAGT